MPAHVHASRRMHRFIAPTVVAAGCFVPAARAGQGAGPVAITQTIRGRVLAADGSRPVPGARVIVADADFGMIFCNTPEKAYAVAPTLPDPTPEKPARFAAEVVADAEGRFAIPSFSRNTFHLLAAHPTLGFALLEHDELAPDAEPLSIALRPPGFVEGTLVGFPFDPSRHILQIQTAAPFRNVSVAPPVERLADGRFRAGPLPALPDWSLSVTQWVYERGFTATLIQVPFRLGSDLRAAPRVDCGGGSRIAGEVRGPAGEPLAFVSVVARGRGEPPVVLGTVTDAAGRYAIGGLANGSYTLEARRWSDLVSAGGCGQGPKDVMIEREIAVPTDDPKQTSFRVERFLDTVREGWAAPLFEAQTTDGRTLDLRELRGKVVVLDFWRTGCVMCRAGLPALLEDYAALSSGEHGRDLVFLGIPLDEDAVAVRKFVESRKLPWAQLVPQVPERNTVALVYNVASTPTIFVVDREGHVAARDPSASERREILHDLLMRPKGAK